MTTRKKIFLIDDDELIVSVLSKALIGEGYEVLAESTEFKDITDKVGAYLP